MFNGQAGTGIADLNAWVPGVARFAIVVQTPSRNQRAMAEDNVTHIALNPHVATSKKHTIKQAGTATLSANGNRFGTS